jgi:HlyD family secretion protein
LFHPIRVTVRILPIPRHNALIQINAGLSPAHYPRRHDRSEAPDKAMTTLLKKPASQPEPVEAPPAPQRAAPPPQRGRKKPLLVLVLLAALLGLAALLYDWLSRPQPAFELTLYGNVDIREVEPAFNDTGTVTRMLVDEGAVVEKGELIATLDDRLYAAALAQAEATMAALRVTYQNDGANYRRDAALAQTGAGTIQQRDNDKAAFDAAKHQYKAARAAVALARRNLAYTKLYAPADGVVEDRILEPGDTASPATPVYTIALANPLWVRAYVPETDLGKIALGMRATVTTDSFPGRKYRGWVGYLSPTAEFTPQTVESPTLRTRLVYQLRVYVCNSHNELRLGMPATVTIDLAQPSPGKPSAVAACGSGNAAGK